MTDVTEIADGLARFEARGPCTDAERRAANWLHDELRAAGHEAWVETQWVRPQWALSIALHATLGVIASVLATSAPLPALILAGVAALFPLRWLLPRRATQNVLVEPGSEGVSLLIAAPYASPRGGIGRRFVEGRELWVAGALLLVAACAGLRLLDLDGLWLGALQFVPTLALLLALAAAFDAAVSSYAGGEQPAAVAIALLAGLEPERLSPGLLLHGNLRERPDVLIRLRSGTGCATGHPQLRAAVVAAGGTPRRAWRGRTPTLWIGADDEAALEFARACVEALDAELR